MQPKPKQSISIATITLYILWDNFGRPIWNVNVERWAEQHNLDQTLNDIETPSVPAWLIDWVDFLTGDFFKGVVALAVILLSIDLVRWIASKFKNRKRKTLDPKELAEQARFVSRVIDANQEFFGEKHFNGSCISVGTYEVIRNICKYAGIKQNYDVFGLSDVSASGSKLAV